jgi:hypothetical protein
MYSAGLLGAGGFRKVKDHFLLVGECYVHGLMDGEAVDLAESNAMPLQIFDVH